MKKVLKLFVVIAMVFVLTGCMKLNVKYEVLSDGKMTMNMEMLMDESLIAMSGKSTDDAIKEMQDGMKSSADMGDAKFVPLEKTINDKKWIGFSVSGETEDSKSMVKEEKIDGVDSLVLTLPLDKATAGIAGGSMDPSSLAAQGYTIETMKTMGTEMNLVVKMPSKATTNVGKADGDTVTIDLLELTMASKREAIVISSPKSSGLPMGIVLGGIGAVAIVAALVLILKNKKKKPEEVAVEEVISPFNADETVQNNTEDVKEVIDEVTPEVVEETKVDTVTEVVDGDKAFCPNCGNAIAGDIEFCPNCGNKVK